MEPQQDPNLQNPHNSPQPQPSPQSQHQQDHPPSQMQHQQSQSQNDQVQKPPIANKNIKDTMKYRLLGNMKGYFNSNIRSKLPRSSYNTFSIIDPEDPDRLKYTPILKQIFKKLRMSRCQMSTTQSQQRTPVFTLALFPQLNVPTQRSIACLLGLSICDALGASTQFIPFDKNRRNLIAYDFQDIQTQIKNRILDARSGKIGIWTDDCSMALCMVDSLLMMGEFVGQHVRFLFHMWLEHGLNNGGRRVSIGLGGNIAISMSQFTKSQSPMTAQKDKFNNGNGSLMRLAPIPIFHIFHSNQQECLDIAQKSSRTTHNGDEAKQCAKLLALILMRLIKRGEGENWRNVLEEACKGFVSEVEGVACLGRAVGETGELFEKQAEIYGNKFLKFNRSVADRNWNWKSPDFTYSKTRTEDNPGYVGSYCMDALAMALHTVWFSNSFQQLALINANMGGDCDTVGAIAGQIGGCIYGISDYMLWLYSQMDDGKLGRFQVFLKALKLVNRNFM